MAAPITTPSCIDFDSVQLGLYGPEAFGQYLYYFGRQTLYESGETPHIEVWRTHKYAHLWTKLDLAGPTVKNLGSDGFIACTISTVRDGDYVALAFAAPGDDDEVGTLAMCRFNLSDETWGTAYVSEHSTYQGPYISMNHPCSIVKSGEAEYTIFYMSNPPQASSDGISWHTGTNLSLTTVSATGTWGSSEVIFGGEPYAYLHVGCCIVGSTVHTFALEVDWTDEAMPSELHSYPKTSLLHREGDTVETVVPWQRFTEEVVGDVPRVSRFVYRPVVQDTTILVAFTGKDEDGAGPTAGLLSGTTGSWTIDYFMDAWDPEWPQIYRKDHAISIVPYDGDLYAIFGGRSIDAADGNDFDTFWWTRRSEDVWDEPTSFTFNQVDDEMGLVGGPSMVLCGPYDNERFGVVYYISPDETDWLDSGYATLFGMAVYAAASSDSDAGGAAFSTF